MSLLGSAALLKVSPFRVCLLRHSIAYLCWKCH